MAGTADPMRALPGIDPGERVQPRAAVGIALSAPGQLTADELLHHADLAMYRAKKSKVADFEMYHDSAEGTEAIMTDDEAPTASAPNSL